MRKILFITRGENLDYENDESYYRGYQESVFGLTCKKAGWDCLRHYEILANGCIPYFPDIADLPPDTITFFSKALVRYGNMLYEKEASDDECADLSRRLLLHRFKLLQSLHWMEVLYGVSLTKLLTFLLLFMPGIGTRDANL